jgi:hypothetical protein
MDKYKKWNYLFEEINKYLINIVEKITFDISYDIWNKYIYDDTSDEYIELIEDISTIIGEILYNNECKKIFKNPTQIYLFSPDGYVSHLISWKYTNELNTILLRFGAFGNVCYIKILIV